MSFSSSLEYWVVSSGDGNKKSIYNEIDNSIGHDRHDKFIYSLSLPFSKQLNKKTKVLIVPGATFIPDKLGEKIPLDTERGYHVHFKDFDHLISRPVVNSNRGFGMSPMDQGLRVVGTVEFGGLENAISKNRIKNLISNAKEMLDGLPEHKDEWLGFRPTLPDFLPVLGPSKNYKNVFYSFGHHHLGWTLGAISGKIISKMISGENTNLDLQPYSSIRFS